jgi:tetratricopeptide (TPR) repeat protein
METQGRILDGIAWMEGLADTWVDCNSFMLGHNWWHTALFHLDRGDGTRVLDIYDNHVWGLDKTYSQDQANAVSLLWRLELRGIDVGDRWQDVAEHVAGRTQEHVQPFLDVHYLYTLARAGRTAAVNELLTSMAAHAEAADPLVRPTLVEVAVPLARGIAAYSVGDFEAAYQDLARATPRLQEIGGSHAQRDLFLQVWLDVLVRSGRAGEALQMLRKRAEARPMAPYGWQLLAQACASLGHSTDAERFRKAAQQAQVSLDKGGLD